VKVTQLIYCFVFRFGLVAAFIIRSLYNSDNNTVSIELEISGVLFLPRGHYKSFPLINFVYYLLSLHLLTYLLTYLLHGAESFLRS